MQQYSFLLHQGEETAENCQTLVEATIQNKLADDELIFYEKQKTFLGKHPLVKQHYAEQKMIRELYKLQQDNPGELVNVITNTVQNVRRISSKLSNKKYKSDSEREAWENNLKLAEAKRDLISRLISQKNTNSSD